MKNLITSIILVFFSTLILAGQGGANPDQDSYMRLVPLSAVANAPDQDAWGMLRVSGPSKVALDQRVGFDLNVSSLPCRGWTWSIDDRATAPFEVYMLKINGEPILTFNTRCPFGDSANGEFTTSLWIWGNDSLGDWLDKPKTDPIHAEIYLASPNSKPPDCFPVMEGWLF